MPGKIIPFLPNDLDLNYTTTFDINDIENNVLLINRNLNGYASGKVFIDEGLTNAEIFDQSYLYYEFVLSQKSIKVWNKNSSPNAGKSKYNALTKITILNAEDIKDTDFACERNNFDGDFT